MQNVPEGGGLYESCRNRNSSPIVIEALANEHERILFASYVNHGTYKASNLSCIKPGSNLNIYINMIQEFGFNHIILIGEREHGIIFLDCYGRVFLWDDNFQMVYPLGDSLEEVPKRPIEDIAWFVENGIVYEYIGEPQGMQKNSMARVYLIAGIFLISFCTIVF